jgi:hypothetical protein
MTPVQAYILRRLMTLEAYADARDELLLAGLLADVVMAYRLGHGDELAMAVSLMVAAGPPCVMSEPSAN